MRLSSILLALFTLLCAALTQAQNFRQYFDGADTIYDSNNWDRSLKVEVDSTPNNIWMIGEPNKNLFNRAATEPNAILTDTLNPYPPNNLSSFKFTLQSDEIYFNGILALQWMQKLDMTFGYDYGRLTYSIDGGTSWESPFNNPYVYNFSGFNQENVTTLESGESVFTGTDSTWKDIWLCFDLSFIQEATDSIIFKYTFTSDGEVESRDGWMIDNFYGHISVQHTVQEHATDRYLSFSPNPVQDRIYITAEKRNGYHIIETMELLTADGKLMRSWKKIPTKFFIDTEDLTNGTYILHVRTNIASETYKFQVAR